MIAEQVHEPVFYEGHLGRMIGCRCRDWEMFCGTTLMPDERAREMFVEQHLADVERDREQARKIAEMDAVLKPGESWVYLPYGRMRHIIDGSPSMGYAWSNCRRQPDLFSAWLGTGSPREVAQLAKLPACKTCMKNRKEPDA